MHTDKQRERIEKEQDLKSQEHLMNLVEERSPKMTIISVGHRPELEKFHQRKLVLEARREGAKLARDIDLPARRKRRWSWPRRGRKSQVKAKAAA